MLRVVLTYIAISCFALWANAQSGRHLECADSVKNKGDYSLAIKLYSTFLEDSKNKRNPGKSKMLIAAYSGRAFCYKKTAKYSLAKSDYEEAITLTSSVNDDPDRYSLYANLSDLLIQMGAYEDAEECLLAIPDNYKALKTHRTANLSTVYQLQGETEKALFMLDNLLSNDIDSNIKRVVLQNRGMCYMNLDKPNYLKAVYDFDLALSFYSNKETDYYIILSNKAIADAHLGFYESALNEIGSCISWFFDNLGTNHSDYIISLRKRAEILYMMKNYSKAKDAFFEYFQNEKRFVLYNFMSMTEQNRLDYWIKEKPLISEIFALESEDPDFLYDVALFRRQVALLGKNDSLTIAEKLSISRDQVVKSLGKNEVAIEFVKYEKDGLYKYAALVLNGNNKKRGTKFVSLWDENSIKSQMISGVSLDKALCSTSVSDKNNVYQSDALSSFVWDKLLPYMPEGSTVFFAPDGILHLLAIEYLHAVNNGKYIFHRLTSTALLAEKIRKCSKTKTAHNTLVIGGMDYDFIPPVEDDESTSHNQDAYNYLLQNNLPRHFEYLHGTKEETESIELYVSNTDRFEDVDENYLKCHMGNYGKIHLATHGYSWHIDIPTIPYVYRDSITEDKSLLASGIALSGANRLYLEPLRDDGLLSARELCEMNLTGVELVVASSCQSAQGRVSDEGPTGIVRGLKKAGVKTIIASLWPVNDDATALLMQFFYEEWREGKGKDGKGCSKTVALHIAQERLREVVSGVVNVRSYNPSRKIGEYKQVITTFGAPYYWAPFIIIDDIN